MNIKDLFDQSADHLQVILNETVALTPNKEEIKDRVRKLNVIHMNLFDTLPHAFKELEVFKFDDAGIKKA